MIYRKTCEICGKEFETTKYQQLLCTLPHPKTCKHCGKLFYVTGMTRKREYCSKECRINDSPEKVCVVCGEKFHPRNSNQRICDKDHYRECPVCYRKFKVTVHTINNVCCSQKCRGVYEKENGAFRKAAEKAKKTCIKKYGVDCYSKTEEYKERVKNTSLSHYGTEYPSQSDEVKSKIHETVLERYGVDHVSQIESIKKSRKKAQKKTCLKRYGVDHPWKLESIREKSRRTKLERYGTEHPSQTEEVQKKIRETSLKRYRADNVRKSEYGKNKIKQTCLERYGVENPFQAEQFKDKTKKTLLEKYGVEYISQSPAIQDKIIKTSMSRYGKSQYTQTDEFRRRFLESENKTCMEKHGVMWPCLYPNVISSHNMISKANRYVAEYLTSVGFDVKYEKYIDGRSYDIYLPGYNIVVEVNPTSTHNTQWNPFLKHGINKNYHLMKTDKANRNGYRCIHLFDWDSVDKLCAVLPIYDTTVYARICEVSNISEYKACEFENKYHLQSSCKGQIVCYGLMFEDELVGVMTFGKPRYNKNCEWEMLRLCYKPGVNVVGGTEKLFHKFVKEYNPRSIVSYCDRSKFTGDVYKKLGMSLSSTSSPVRHWYSYKKSEKMQHITDNFLRQRGFDQIFGTSYGKGTSNEELMLERGYLPVYDCGQMTFEWHNAELYCV